MGREWRVYTFIHNNIHWISRKFTVDLPDSSEEVVSLLTKLFILFSYIL